jgi:hypothetical protein
MASKTLFSLLTAAAAGKGINSTLNLDTQFDTGVPAVTNLTAANDLIFTTLDAPAGTPIGYQAIGFNIIAAHTLNMGAGNDQLQITQGSALNAVGIKIGTGSTLDLGAGTNKVVITLTGAGSVGVNNQSKFLAGSGGDTIKADAVLNGFVNGSATNKTALFNTGAGGDVVAVSGETGHGLVNYGTITMGLNTEADKDSITGSSAGHPLIPAAPAYTPTKFGIFNAGTINMGGGKDVIDALVGGFGGGGTYNLGFAGDVDADAVLGFGAGTFNGGGGRNSITLPDGAYTINYASVNGHKPTSLTDLASGTITRNGDLTTVMTFNQFDGIGGSAPTAGLHFFNPALIGTGGTVLTSITIDTLGNNTAVTFA